MENKFLKRTLNPRTMVYDFDDGSSPIPYELAVEMKSIRTLIPTIFGLIVSGEVKEAWQKRITPPQ